MISHIKSERLIFLITAINAQFDDYAKFGNDEESSFLPLLTLGEMWILLPHLLPILTSRETEQMLHLKKELPGEKTPIGPKIMSRYKI